MSALIFNDLYLQLSDASHILSKLNKFDVDNVIFYMRRAMPLSLAYARAKSNW